MRRILGYGLTITRGAASAMMFTYSSLLVMMCHNTITVLRSTILQFYIPFDSAIEMHKYIACWALIFTGKPEKTFYFKPCISYVRYSYCSKIIIKFNFSNNQIKFSLCIYIELYYMRLFYTLEFIYMFYIFIQFVQYIFKFCILYI